MSRGDLFGLGRDRYDGPEVLQCFCPDAANPSKLLDPLERPLTGPVFHDSIRQGRSNSVQGLEGLCRCAIDVERFIGRRCAPGAVGQLILRRHPSDLRSGLGGKGIDGERRNLLLLYVPDGKTRDKQDRKCENGEGFVPSNRQALLETIEPDHERRRSERQNWICAVD